MMEMVDTVFETRTDPDQLQVNEGVLARLQQLHPASVSGMEDDEGPMVWVLLIPTTKVLMERFLRHELSEQQLFDQTPVGASYDCIYLCSAMVLEEFRRKGYARAITTQAIREMTRVFPISDLFVWSFTPEGDAAAEAIASEVELPLRRRLDKVSIN